MPAEFQIVAGFPEDQRPEAARLFWQAFSAKLGKVLGPEDKALCLFERILDPRFAISALAPGGKLLGMAGYKTGDGALTGGGLKDLTSVYGTFGGLWRGLLLEVLERETEREILLMDGIFVSETARGMGIGTALLNAVCDEAARRELSRVRLDVIDTNPRARALYERAGFEAVEEARTGIFEVLFGFASATRMEKPV